MAVAILGNTQLQRPHTGHKGAVVVSGAIAHTMPRALALRRPGNRRHLALQNTLQIAAKALPDEILVLAEQLFDSRNSVLDMAMGHGVSFLRRK